MSNNVRDGNAKGWRYNWTKDPAGYLNAEGKIPQGRCYHCGSKYASPSAFSAYCSECWFEMNLDRAESGPGLWKTIRERVRIDDDD